MSKSNKPRLHLQPITYKEACVFIDKYHRHHLHPQGWKFGIAANDGVNVVGVVTVGRPVSRMIDHHTTLEVTRLCTNGTRLACSFLYGAAWRATKALGYQRLITYTLSEESGKSLNASGWKPLYETKGGTWDRSGRPRVDTAPTSQKQLWEAP